VFLFISRSRKLINVSVEILLCQVIGPAAAPGLPDLFLRAKVLRSSLVQYHVVSVPCGRCCDASAGRRRGASFLCSSCTRRADTKSSRPSPGVELSDSAWRERRGCYRHAGLVELSDSVPPHRTRAPLSDCTPVSRPAHGLYTPQRNECQLSLIDSGVVLKKKWGHA